MSTVSRSALNSSIEFTKQLALYFVTIVLMLFIVVTNKYQQTRQYSLAAESVKGVTDTVINTGTSWPNNVPLLTCEICQQKYNKKTLCMEPSRKRSYCGDRCPAGSIGGTNGVCDQRPTEKPLPTSWPTIVRPSPAVTCPVYQPPNPPDGCTYRWEKCYEPGCSPCPKPRLVCLSGTPQTSCPPLPRGTPPMGCRYVYSVCSGIGCCPRAELVCTEGTPIP